MLFLSEERQQRYAHGAAKNLRGESVGGHRLHQLQAACGQTEQARKHLVVENALTTDAAGRKHADEAEKRVPL